MGLVTVGLGANRRHNLVPRLLFHVGVFAPWFAPYPSNPLMVFHINVYYRVRLPRPFSTTK